MIQVLYKEFSEIALVSRSLLHMTFPQYELDREIIIIRIPKLEIFRYGLNTVL